MGHDLELGAVAEALGVPFLSLHGPLSSVHAWPP